jgi:hypothetical protein
MVFRSSEKAHSLVETIRKNAKSLNIDDALSFDADTAKRYKVNTKGEIIDSEIDSVLDDETSCWVFVDAYCVQQCNYDLKED